MNIDILNEMEDHAMINKIKQSNINDMLKCYYPLHECLTHMIATKPAAIEEFTK
jgi:hypothetical protein